MENRGAVPITVSVPYEMAKWLEKNKRQINRSKIFQDAIKDLMQNQRKVSPLLLLVITMGFAFGISLTLVSTLVYAYGFFTSTVLFIVGCFVILNSLYVLVKEVKLNARYRRT